MIALIALIVLFDGRTGARAADVLIRSHGHEDPHKGALGPDLSAPKKAFVVRPGGGLQKESFIEREAKSVSGHSVMHKIRRRSATRVSQLRQLHRRQMLAAYLRLLHRQTPDVVPTTGLLAWFKGSTCSSTWPNSANGSSASVSMGGAPAVTSKVQQGTYLSGGATDSVTFGTVAQVLGTQAYTVCTVSAYGNSSTGLAISSGRVFGTTALPNWFQGQSKGYSGVAMYGDVSTTAATGGYVTSYYLASGTSTWTVMCGSGDGGQGSAVYVNGPGDKGSGTIGAGANVLTGNVAAGSVVYQGPETVSPWYFMELITWNRVLSAYEINPVMNYLMAGTGTFVPATTTTTMPNITKASGHRTATNLCVISVLLAVSSAA